MRSPQNTATPLARSGFVRGRLVGAAAIAFAVLVVIENLVVLDGTRRPTALRSRRCWPTTRPTGTRSRSRSGLEALYLPLLLVFVTGLHGLVERRGGAGADWSRLALAAGATLLGHLRASTPFCGSGSCCPPAGSPSRRPCSSSSGRCMLRRSRWRCRHSAPPSSARRWPTHASGLTPAVAAPAGRGGREPAARCGAGQPRDRGRLGADLRRAPGFVAWLVWLLATGVRLVSGRDRDEGGAEVAHAGEDSVEGRLVESWAA